MSDQPVQRVGPPTAVPLPLVDLSTLPEEERVSARDRSLAQLIAERFHLATGPVLRARVIRLSETEHTLAIVAHHVATDGMSFNLLTTELVELYRAAQERRAPSLPELRIQFRDFAAWRQARENAGGGIEYWTRVLKDGPVLELPADFPRPPLPDHAGARAHLLLPPAETAALARLASEAGATPFMALLGALALVLGRWTGAEELVIGAPVIDRPHPDSESLIGVFLNSLALRIDLRGDPSFRELVVRVQQTAAGAYAHSDVPFEQVVDALDVPRDTSRHPVFEVMLNHLAMRAPDLELPGLTLRRLPDPSPRAKLPLTLYSGLRDGSLGLNLVYQTALFSAARMACLLDELRHVIETVTAAPDAPIGACSLLTPAALKLLPDPASSLPAA
ncbi:MAG: Malonyl CoA-acyl carrier protein transacylase, partial [Armatimonadetes bacterium]|nr:Malonyl CoA-acyl carrier protein transacylase [Armatimonadota bacterium]